MPARPLRQSGGVGRGALGAPGALSGSAAGTLHPVLGLQCRNPANVALRLPFLPPCPAKDTFIRVALSLTRDSLPSLRDKASPVASGRVAGRCLDTVRFINRSLKGGLWTRPASK